MELKFKEFGHALVSEMYEGNDTPVDGSTYVLGKHEVSEKLYQFATALQREPAFRGIKFAQRERFYTSNEVWVYHPDHVYAMGRIGYRDYNVSENSPIKYSYMVTTPRVRNYKYRHHHSAQYWALSTNMDRAVTNAKKLLRTYSLEETAYLTQRRVNTDLGQEILKAGNERSRKLQVLLRHPDSATSPVLKELRHLRSIGHQWKTEEFAGELEEAIAAVEQEEALHSNVFRIAMVSIRESAVGTMYTVVEGPTEGIRVTYNGIKSLETTFADENWVHNHQRVFTEGDLPDDIRLSLASLAMVPDNTFVFGTGYRVCSRLAYVLY